MVKRRATRVKVWSSMASWLVLSFAWWALEAQPLAPTLEELDSPPAQTQQMTSVSGDGDPFAAFFEDRAGPILATDCEATNSAFLVTVVLVDLLALALFFIVHFIIVRRNWLSSLGGGFWSFTAPLLPFCLAAAVALPIVRHGSEIYLGCLQNADLRRLLVLSELAPWLQGLLLGALPVLLTALLAKLLQGLVMRA